ncbi:hypothetical protein NQ314_009970 [Rhamnusium bicolor]|uniref:Uncharacterized protein n=1 Tax=Rhamnusium bicolor TaxID=1586634 RepID=A0AAV8XVP0_9CUCU|nr:hypothetical protein NQ314_009970 [Rhamnusium bicolor]
MPKASPGKTSRQYRIKTVVNSAPWVLFDEQEEQDNPLPPDPVHDSLTILAITITTIMLMAAKHSDIPKEHLRWALSYLECVKDEYGNAPPNVRGIMNNIKLLDDSVSTFFDEMGGENAPAEEAAAE